MMLHDRYTSATEFRAVGKMQSANTLPEGEKSATRHTHIPTALRRLLNAVSKEAIFPAYTHKKKRFPSAESLVHAYAEILLVRLKQPLHASRAAEKKKQNKQPHSQLRKV